MYNIKADRTPSEEKLFHYHSSILSFGELYYQLTWLGYSIPSKWFGNKSTTNKQPRIEVPIFYEDARGQQRTSGMHYVLLPHEILGTFYQFEAADLMMKLTGGPGVSWMQSFRGALGNSRYIYTHTPFMITLRLWRSSGRMSKLQNGFAITLFSESHGCTIFDVWNIQKRLNDWIANYHQINIHILDVCPQPPSIQNMYFILLRWLIPTLSYPFVSSGMGLKVAVAWPQTYEISNWVFVR